VATSTVLDLITASLRKIGVHPSGEAPEADEAQDAIDELNRMLETWTAQRRLVFRRLAATKTVTPGVPSLTIGPGGDIPIARPLAIREAYFKIGTIDYPIDIFYADQYANIGLKSLQTFWPTVLYYDPAFPLGVITFYPIPAAAGELHVQVDMPFSAFSAVTDLLSFPPSYADGLVYALGKRLAPEYGRTLSAEFMDDWRRTENALAKVNHRPVIAITDPRLPGAGVTDPNWIQHGGFR